MALKITRTITTSDIAYVETVVDEQGVPSLKQATETVLGNISDKTKAAAYLKTKLGKERTFTVISVTATDRKYEMDTEVFIAHATEVSGGDENDTLSEEDSE